jgi:hypothetical protein
MSVCWFLCLDFHGCGLVREGPDEAVSVAIFCNGDRDFCLDDGVDTADLVSDLPGALEKEGVVDVALELWHGDGGERGRKK